MVSKKRDFYTTIYEALKVSTNLSKIIKDLSISKQQLNYYLRKMLLDGLLLHKSKGYYEVLPSKNSSPQHTKTLVDSIRGHAFIWSVKLPVIKDWDKRIEILEKAKVPFKLVGAFQKTPRIFIKNKKVWLGNKTLTIYETKSFYGKNAIQSRKYAVISLLEVLGALESKLGINIHPYLFKPRREHYGLIKNDLAIQCNRKKEKIHVKDNLEGEWLWIDDSLQIGELETGGVKAMVRSIQVQKFWNDNKQWNFEVTPSFLMESISGLIQTQQMNADNIIKHQKVLDEMLITLKKIQEKL